MAQLSLSQWPAEKESRLVSASPVYYGWIVVAAATVGMAMTMPGQTAGVSLFIDQIMIDVGVTRSTVSLIYTIATILGAASLSQIGRWIDRFGPRKAVVVIAAGLGIACGVMSMASGVATLFLGFLLLRALGPGALSLVNLHVVNIWFVRKRGTAIGFMGVGIAAATAVYPLFIEHGLAAFSWRGSFLIVGLILLIVMVPIGWLLYREHPEKYGIIPDGQSAGGGFGAEATSTLAEARRTLAFWLLTVSGVSVASLGTGLLFHHFSIMDANGVDRIAATAVFVPLGLVTAGSNVFSGYLADRISPRILVGAMLIIFALMLSSIPLVTTPTHVWFYGSLFGVVQGLQGALMGSGFAHYFGRKHIGAIKGFAKTIFVGGTAAGPIVYALGLDFMGSYGPMLYATAAFSAALAVTAFVLSDRRLEPADEAVNELHREVGV
ncbi:MAG: MFS transporter [Rhodothermales bacterium]